MTQTDLLIDLFATFESKKTNPLGVPMIVIESESLIIKPKRASCGRTIGLASVKHCNCPALITEWHYENKDPMHGRYGKEVDGYSVCCNSCDIETPIYPSLSRALTRMKRLALLPNPAQGR